MNDEKVTVFIMINGYSQDTFHTSHIKHTLHTQHSQILSLFLANQNKYLRNDAVPEVIFNLAICEYCALALAL